jgi:hypothetical protein
MFGEPQLPLKIRAHPHWCSSLFYFFWIANIFIREFNGVPTTTNWIIPFEYWNRSLCYVCTYIILGETRRKLVSMVTLEAVRFDLSRQTSFYYFGRGVCCCCQVHAGVITVVTKKTPAWPALLTTQTCDHSLSSIAKLHVNKNQATHIVGSDVYFPSLTQILWHNNPPQIHICFSKSIRIGLRFFSFSFNPN